MNEHIQHILDDLYEIDPELKKHETDLVPAIKALLAAKPDIKLDQEFVIELKRKVLGTEPKRIFFSSLFANRFAIITGSGLIALLIAIPLVYHFTEGGLNSIETPSVAFNFSDEKTKAFGSLVDSSSDQQGATLSRSVSGVGAGGGGGMTKAESSTSDSAMIAPSSELYMPSPEPYFEEISYSYVYKGGTLDLLDVSNNVYRRENGFDLNNSIISQIKENSLGAVNISALNNPEITSISIADKSKNGYSIQVNPSEGDVFISQDWRQYEQAVSSYYEPIQIDDLPTEDKLIKIAEKFLAQYQIDMTLFGEPHVIDQWIFTASRNGHENYAPDQVTLVYPLLLDEKEIYSESGSPFGLSVNIDIRSNKVNHVSYNASTKFDRSSYELETDSEAILKIAEHGGLYQYQSPNPTNIVEIELGNPEIVLMLHNRFNPESGSQTLFVPALRFPILNAPSDAMLYRDNIVIPLVKEILKSETEPVYRTMTEPMPAPAIEDMPEIEAVEITNDE